MLGNRLTRRLTPRRLAILLSVFFLLLAIPTVALVWHAYGQLKWESFHLHRSQAESLRERIDAQLLDIMRQTDSRPVGDFSFQSSTGLSPDEPILRSPLAGLSPAPAMPGLIGYFQVRSDGTFSSPVLPAVGVDPDSVGISHDELNERRMHAARIREILADNRLVRDSGTGLDEAAAATNGNNAAAKERSRSMAPSSPRQSNATEQEEDPAAASATQRFATPESGRGAGNDSAGGRARPAGQVVFDSLNQPDSQQAPSNRNELAETDRRASPGSALEATVNPVPKKVRECIGHGIHARSPFARLQKHAIPGGGRFLLLSPVENMGAQIPSFIFITISHVSRVGHYGLGTGIRFYRRAPAGCRLFPGSRQAKLGQHVGAFPARIDQFLP